MQGIKFLVELNAIPFGGCEVVLGTQWPSTLGDIKWDFKLLTMQFTYSGKQVMLRGVQPEKSTFQEGVKFFTNGATKGLILHISTPVLSSMPLTQLAEPLQQLLEEYSQVFETPIGLPPLIGHEHKIILKESSPPVCKQPYRYPFPKI